MTKSDIENILGVKMKKIGHDYVCQCPVCIFSAKRRPFFLHFPTWKRKSWEWKAKRLQELSKEKKNLRQQKDKGVEAPCRGEIN